LLTWLSGLLTSDYEYSYFRIQHSICLCYTFMIIALSLFVEFIFSWLNYSSLSIQNISDCPSIWLSYTNWITRSGWCGERTSIRRWRRGRRTPTTGDLKLLPEVVLHRPQDLQREPKDLQHEAQDLHHASEGWCAKEATSTTSDHKFVFLSPTSSVWFNLLLLWWDECLGCICFKWLAIVYLHSYDLPLSVLAYVYFAQWFANLCQWLAQLVMEEC
jgi:hypothetical protein